MHDQQLVSVHGRVERRVKVTGRVGQGGQHSSGTRPLHGHSVGRGQRLELDGDGHSVGTGRVAKLHHITVLQVLGDTLLVSASTSKARGANVIGNLGSRARRDAHLDEKPDVDRPGLRRVDGGKRSEARGERDRGGEGRVRKELQSHKIRSLPLQVKGVHSLLHAILSLHGDLKEVASRAELGLHGLVSKVGGRTVDHDGHKGILVLRDGGKDDLADINVNVDDIVQDRRVEEGGVQRSVSSNVEDADTLQTALSSLQPDSDDRVGPSRLAVLASHHDVHQVLTNGQRNALAGLIDPHLVRHGRSVDDNGPDVLVGREGGNIEAVNLLDKGGDVHIGLGVKGGVDGTAVNLQLLQRGVRANVEEQTVVWREWKVVKDLLDLPGLVLGSLKRHRAKVVEGVKLVERDLLHGILHRRVRAVVEVERLVLERAHLALRLSLHQVAADRHSVVRVDLLGVQGEGESHAVLGVVLAVQRDLDVHDSQVEAWSLANHGRAVIGDDVLAVDLGLVELAQGRDSGEADLKRGRHGALGEPDTHGSPSHVGSHRRQHVVDLHVVVVVKGATRLSVGDSIKGDLQLDRAGTRPKVWGGAHNGGGELLGVVERVGKHDLLAELAEKGLLTLRDDPGEFHRHYSSTARWPNARRHGDHADLAGLLLVRHILAWSVEPVEVVKLHVKEAVELPLVRLSRDVELRVTRHSVGGDLGDDLVVLLRHHDGEVPGVHRVIHAVQRHGKVSVSQGVNMGHCARDAGTRRAAHERSPAPEPAKVTLGLQDASVSLPGHDLAVQADKHGSSPPNAADARRHVLHHQRLVEGKLLLRRLGVLHAVRREGDVHLLGLHGLRSEANEGADAVLSYRVVLRNNRLVAELAKVVLLNLRQGPSLDGQGNLCAPGRGTGLRGDVIDVHPTSGGCKCGSRAGKHKQDCGQREETRRGAQMHVARRHSCP